MPWKYVIYEEKLSGTIENIWHRPRKNFLLQNKC